MPAKNGKRLPAVRQHAAVDRGTKQLRRWWRQHHFGDVVDVVSLAQAMADVGVLSLATLAQVLTDPKASRKDRMRIALVMAPKMVAEARGRLRSGQGAASGGGGLDDLMGAYNLTVKASNRE